MAWAGSLLSGIGSGASGGAVGSASGTAGQIGSQLGQQGVSAAMNSQGSSYNHNLLNPVATGGGNRRPTDMASIIAFMNSQNNQYQPKRWY